MLVSVQRSFTVIAYSVTLTIRYRTIRYALYRDIFKRLFPGCFCATLVVGCSTVDECCAMRVSEYYSYDEYPSGSNEMGSPSGSDGTQQLLNGYVLNIKIDSVRPSDLFIRAHVRDAHVG